MHTHDNIASIILALSCLLPDEPHVLADMERPTTSTLMKVTPGECETDDVVEHQSVSEQSSQFTSQSVTDDIATSTTTTETSLGEFMLFVSKDMSCGCVDHCSKLAVRVCVCVCVCV